MHFHVSKTSRHVKYTNLPKPPFLPSQQKISFPDFQSIISPHSKNILTLARFPPRNGNDLQLRSLARPKVSHFSDLSVIHITDDLTHANATYCARHRNKKEKPGRGMRKKEPGYPCASRVMYTCVCVPGAQQIDRCSRACYKFLHALIWTCARACVWQCHIALIRARGVDVGRYIEFFLYCDGPEILCVRNGGIVVAPVFGMHYSFCYCVPINIHSLLSLYLFASLGYYFSLFFLEFFGYAIISLVY